MNERSRGRNRLGAAIFFFLILLLAGIAPGYGWESPAVTEAPPVGAS